MLKGDYWAYFKDVVTYRFSPTFPPEKHYMLGKYGVSLLESVKNEQEKTYAVLLRLHNNPAPFALIILGIIGIIALGGVVMVFDRLERVVENPALMVFLVVLAVVLLVGVVRFVVRQARPP